MENFKGMWLVYDNHVEWVPAKEKQGNSIMILVKFIQFFLKRT